MLFLVALKSFVLYALFKLEGESKSFSKEIGVRLSQTSEFSLIIVNTAAVSGFMTASCSHLIKLVTIVTMIVSC